ncbi:MAG: hypothetical protein KBS35_00075, partial [Mycoplasma sp.]|nr:hypothetical protein [Candidatus Hennigella equi]
MKNKFLKALTLFTLSGGAIGSLVTLGSCATSKTETKTEPFGIKNEDGYCIVTFLGAPGVTFSGQTHVKVPKGSFFASVNTPVAQHGKLKFDCWSKKLNVRDPISPKEVINNNIDIYAYFKDEIDLSQCVGMAAIEQTTITVAHSGSVTGDIAQSLEFSRNYGEEWTNINDDEDHAIELAPGDTIFFKGDNAEGFNKAGSDDNIYFEISQNGAVNIVGNVMGLLDNATGTATTIPCANCFEGLFKANEDNYGIKYVSNSFLPATTLTDSCYAHMFDGQKRLMTAPWLPAKQLADDCYNYMFYNCSLLDFIKIDYAGKFLDATEYPYTLYWVDGISSNGTIIYNGTETDKGRSSIPTDWTVKKAPEPEHYDDIIIECADEPADDLYVDNHPYQFIATVPGEGVFQDVTWLSDDTSVASVNPVTGVVTPIKEGTCNILAYSKVDQTVGGSKEIRTRDIDFKDCTKFSTNSSQTISWDYGGSGTLPNFKYSYDGKNWFNLVTSVSITSDTPIYVKGNNPTGIGSANSHTRFIFDESEDAGDVYISGSVNALVDDAR